MICGRSFFTAHPALIAPHFPAPFDMLGCGVIPASGSAKTSASTFNISATQRQLPRWIVFSPSNTLEASPFRMLLEPPFRSLLNFIGVSFVISTFLLRQQISMSLPVNYLLQFYAFFIGGTIRTIFSLYFFAV
jgi:hypothetical protein